MTTQTTSTTAPLTQATRENSQRPGQPAPSTPRPYANVRPAPNQIAYRWNAEELSDSPLRKCVAVLPLLF